MTRLRRSSPTEAGWTRRRAGRGFTYLDSDGARLARTDADRARSLAIPPAWREVWICPHENGHLQAVGTDRAGRRQYIYHQAWQTRRDAEKFDRARALGRALPKVRDHLARDLAEPDLSAARACALAVRLLDVGFFRIGSDTYTDEHGSFGLTTLERSHVRLGAGAATFSFNGKSDIEREVVVDDALCLATIQKLRRRRGGFSEFLAFKDGRRWSRLGAAQVNQYLGDVSGLEISAKDFRTWHGTVRAAVALAGSEEAGDSKASRKRAVGAAMVEVGEFLGNTPTVARTSYVDPRVLDRFEEGRTVTVRRSAAGSPSVADQQRIERSVLRLLA
ncbi:DNA topoisomerase IB [Nocardioides sp. JQ2195]|uniref:DNA topoisomerase IB n=1 Tax=Nocardioides sp. JQ2195 TaxID=2592334 RepID=UPI00143EA6D7|nr:DNA topoisomerase IB [Nocardioides sp. JQ2195]QIX27566.1 DNA topoisomerase IB [Nocardioides sp. JQ2195]